MARATLLAAPAWLALSGSHAGASSCLPSALAALPAPHLPKSPVAAVLLLLAILAITYALLTLFIRVSVPAAPRADDDEGYEDEEEEEETETPDPEWASETVPRGLTLPEPAEPPVPVEPSPVEPLSVESVRVRGARIALGDTASEVMRCFAPGEGNSAPLVERLAGGEAASVTRSYRVGAHTLALTFERAASDEPLRLARIDIEG